MYKYFLYIYILFIEDVGPIMLSTLPPFVLEEEMGIDMASTLRSLVLREIIGRGFAYYYSPIFMFKTGKGFIFFDLFCLKMQTEAAVKLRIV